jgi:hypothetical protein
VISCDLNFHEVQIWIVKEVWAHLIHFRSCDLDFGHKSYGLTRSQPHYKKKKESSNIAYPINEHCNIDICHKSYLSPNINTSKLIIDVENFMHLYSRAEINTKNKAKMCLVIKP